MMSVATDRAMRLAEYIAGWHRRPFEWAGANCCHFPACWVAAITGRDPMAGLPTTPSAHAARRVVLMLGGSLADAWSNRLAQQPMSAGMAQLGDVVLTAVMPSQGGVGAAVGICGGRLSAFVTERDGIVWLPTTSAVWAWRVGGAA